MASGVGDPRAISQTFRMTAYSGPSIPARVETTPGSGPLLLGMRTGGASRIYRVVWRIGGEILSFAVGQSSFR